MERVFFIADTHFGHRNIIKYTDRPFPNIEEHDNQLIYNWNKVVKKDDKVFMLGDFALVGKNKVIEIGQKLNGKKILIYGNHDGASLATYYAAGFEMISKYPIVYENFLLSHIPQDDTRGFINVHGHVHNKEERLLISYNHFCVSVENINYTPIELKQLNKRITEKAASINEHFLFRPKSNQMCRVSLR